MSKLILLFDVDGTLTPSGENIKEDMMQYLLTIKEINKEKNIELGIVGGGNYEKIKWQMNNKLDIFKYIFCECGSVVYIDGELVNKKNILDIIDRNYLNEIIRQALKIISEMPIIFNGHQIDFRNGLIYISPPGMQAQKYEREIFKNKDKLLNIRLNLINELKKKDHEDLFDIVTGGEVGVAIYPKNWDKSQILIYFENEKNIYYFGDKTEPGGNDYPIYSNPKVKGISVKDYKETLEILRKILL